MKKKLLFALFTLSAMTCYAQSNTPLNTTIPSGSNNTAVGQYTLRANTSSGQSTGVGNTGIGWGALANGIGSSAVNQLTGVGNTGVGVQALNKTTSGTYNVAVGNAAMDNNTTGHYNTALGYNAVLGNTSGEYNIGIGFKPLYQATSNTYNVGIGYQAGFGVSGNGNLLFGSLAGYQMNGNGNVAIGAGAGKSLTGNDNVVIGKFETATTLNNTMIFSTNLGNTRLFIDNLGNAGLGTGVATPGNKLEIKHGTTGNSGLRFTNLTSTYTPPASLKTDKFLSVDNNGNVVMMNVNTTPVGTDSNTNIYNTDGTIEATPNHLRVVNFADNDLYFHTTDTTGYGRIYIGRHISEAGYPVESGLDSDYRLFVEKGILTEKVKVALRNTSNWADYVFSDTYELKPLSEVAAFIEENKHLPGIASAEELKNNGLDLGAMQAKQMEKIEELTLYAIEQDKMIQNQKKALDKQAADIEELKAQVKLLLERK